MGVLCSVLQHGALPWPRYGRKRSTSPQESCSCTSTSMVTQSVSSSFVSEHLLCACTQVTHFSGTIRNVKACSHQASCSVPCRSTNDQTRPPLAGTRTAVAPTIPEDGYLLKMHHHVATQRMHCLMLQFKSFSLYPDSV